MTQTIDVTGLPPDSVRAIEPLVTHLRGYKPSEPATPARQAVTSEETVTDPPAYTLPFDQWLVHFRRWVDSHPIRKPVEIDDSRETIYAGRGE